ncbi:CD109 antigen-like protein [Leptotrombidium deliense]|uniref:CD109 antigen-like protein n=1 Tax=Leptotrombidium deliense TaxID=299467 RepID=A0A443RVN8_9ACAR|nr:CD109 antigen-like protein [Leptotrombidium deliense]
MSSQIRNVTLKATGEGTAIMQLSWQYNTANATKEPSFKIRYDIDEGTVENILSLNVYISYLKEGASGMTVMEVTLPSGYVADLEALDDVKKSGAKRVETKNENTVIVVYFDELTEEEKSLKILANRKVKLADLKPVPIKVYDYYDTTKSATVFYTPKQLSTCDICEGDDCGKSCKPGN